MNSIQKTKLLLIAFSEKKAFAYSVKIGGNFYSVCLVWNTKQSMLAKNDQPNYPKDEAVDDV